MSKCYNEVSTKLLGVFQISWNGYCMVYCCNVKLIAYCTFLWKNSRKRFKNHYWCFVVGSDGCPFLYNECTITYLDLALYWFVRRFVIEQSSSIYDQQDGECKLKRKRLYLNTGRVLQINYKILFSDFKLLMIIIIYKCGFFFIFKFSCIKSVLLKLNIVLHQSRFEPAKFQQSLT